MRHYTYEGLTMPLVQVLWSTMGQNLSLQMHLQSLVSGGLKDVSPKVSLH